MEHLWLFALFVFGIVLVPGMDMAFVLSSALVGGTRAGLAAVAGILLGGLAHVAMGMAGVGLLLKLFPAAFNAVLVAGALYIAWIGLSLWRAPATLGEVRLDARRSDAGTFLRGLATCLLNPKAYVFMVAVFPQFVRPGAAPLAAQAAAMAAIVALSQLAVYGAVAAGAAGLRATLARDARLQARTARAVALLLMGTAAWTLSQSWAPA